MNTLLNIMSVIRVFKIKYSKEEAFSSATDIYEVKT